MNDKTAGWLVFGGVAISLLGAGAWLATRPVKFGAFSWDTWRAKYAELPPDVLEQSDKAWKLTPIAEAAEASGVAKSWLDNPGDPEHWDASQAHHDVAMSILTIINALHRESAQASPDDESDAAYHARVDESNALEARFRPLMEAHEALAKYHTVKKMPGFRSSHNPPSHDEAMALVQKYGKA